MQTRHVLALKGTQGGTHMGSCLSEGIVSKEVPLKFRILLRGCPCWGYAWAYLLGGAIVGASLQMHHITSESWFTCCPNTDLVLHCVSPRSSITSSITHISSPASLSSWRNICTRPASPNFAAFVIRLAGSCALESPRVVAALALCRHVRAPAK